MKYRLLLTDMVNGGQSEIVVPAHLLLEDLSAKLKVELQLPLCDHGWHRFIARGATYVINEHLSCEEDMIFEAGLTPGRHRSSERERLWTVFTVLGSAVTYIQDGDRNIKARITLLQRI